MVTKKIPRIEDEAEHEFFSPVQSIIANAENLFSEAEEGSELKNIAEDVLHQVFKLYFIAEEVVLEERDKFGYEFNYVDILPIIQDAINETEEGSELKNIAEDILQQVTKLYFIAETIKGSALEGCDEFGYEFHNADILPIIQDTIILFRKEAKNKGVAINSPVMEEAIHSSIIEMSEPRIKRVFFNLIDNAVKYSCTSIEHLERDIAVVCKPYGNFYCVEISNQGVGIKPEEISEGLIFKNRYRGILARDRSKTGSGVGLSTVKRIIEAHSGCIEVESKLMGCDPIIDPYKTTFKVCIPFHQPNKERSTWKQKEYYG